MASDDTGAPFEAEPFPAGSESVFLHGADHEFDDGPIVVPGMPKPARRRRPERASRPRPERSRPRERARDAASESGAPAPSRRRAAKRRGSNVRDRKSRKLNAVLVWIAIVFVVIPLGGGLISCASDVFDEVVEAIDGTSPSSDADYSYSYEFDLGDVSLDPTELGSDETYDDLGATYHIVFDVDAPVLDKQGGSLIPVAVTGTTAEGDPLDETFFISSSGYGLEVPYGEYSVSVLASPITYEGVIFRIPAEPISITVDEDYFDLNPVLSFEEIPAAEMSEEDVDLAYEYALAGGCYSEGTADMLRDLALERMQGVSSATLS